MLEGLNTLRKRTVGVDVWAVGMKARIKTLHLWSLALGKGGWAEVTAGDYARVGGVVRGQYERLDRFVEEIRAGLPLDGRASVRVQMYAEAARRMYHEVEHEVVTGAGYTQERNILHPTAEHCPDCLRMTALGWVPLGSIPPVGTVTCRTRDKCHREYRT